MSLLLTGGTGFLGMELIARLLDSDDPPEIFMAVRARDEVAAEARIAEVLAQLYETVPASAACLRAVPADLTQPNLGISTSQRATLATHVDRVAHCAASIAFTLPLGEARAVNVEGTGGMVELARGLPRLEQFVHVSTAYVSGRLRGAFRESHVGGCDFRNTYERSKMEAELLVAMASDLPTAIVRPSIVVGESDSGWTSAFNVLYWPLQAFARGLLDRVPADPMGIVDTVPVDYVAALIERVAFTTGVTGRFHAVAGDTALTVAELIIESCRELERPLPELIEPGSFGPDNPASVFAPYFDVETRFDNRRASLLMADAGPAPDPVDYLPRIIEFARDARWGKRRLTRQAARALAGISDAQIASA